MLFFLITIFKYLCLLFYIKYSCNAQCAIFELYYFMTPVTYEMTSDPVTQQHLCPEGVCMESKDFLTRPPAIIVHLI